MPLQSWASLVSVNNGPMVVRCQFSYRVEVTSTKLGERNYGSGDALCTAGELKEIDYVYIIAVNRTDLRGPFVETGRIDAIGFGLNIRSFLRSIVLAQPTGKRFARPNSPALNTYLTHAETYQNELMAELFESSNDESFALTRGFSGWALSLAHSQIVFNEGALDLNHDCLESNLAIHLWQDHCFHPRPQSVDEEKSN